MLQNQPEIWWNVCGQASELKSLWLTTCFRCTDAQFLCYVLPLWKREHTFWTFGPTPSSILHLVVKVDSEAGGVHVLLGVKFGSWVREEAIVMCCGTGGGWVHVHQQNTGHVQLKTNIHLSGDKGIRLWAKCMLACWCLSGIMLTIFAILVKCVSKSSPFY